MYFVNGTRMELQNYSDIANRTSVRIKAALIIYKTVFSRHIKVSRREFE